jgi:hypothetical protein
MRERIQTLDERLARLRAEKQRLLARASRTARTRDTRRKILVGGAVLAAVDHEGVPSLRSRADLLRWIDTQLTRPHDRGVFEFALQKPVAGDDTRRSPATQAPSAGSDAVVKEAVTDMTARQGTPKRG